MIINEKAVKKIEVYACPRDLRTGKRASMRDWRVTVQFVDGHVWNDGGHGTRKAALAYAHRYAR
ncbi:hypothetical protein PVE_R2G0558 [Pseudomonas veronii 1YdBTEX2]|uniref:Uncharacterized protein n=1 Tax=Pseudomonas veronii 1YdBTEX2 TaxID=1295141 RepID=A0A1D3K891_PSEVE|nr:hypothetical protein [Pseudomonas sp. AP19]OEC64330.1 hypothetical protein A7D21_33560 [Pseudomonas sp. AP19]SBW84584.1 hypothetical protein PVE_R2G0558 [Pseudomonas veronii 1YdBTEX2]